MKTIRDVMDMEVGAFELSVRCCNCMANMGIRTLAELTSHSQEEIAKSRNMGKVSMEQINSRLKSLDLTYSMDDRAWLQWGLNHIELIKTL